MFDQAVRLCYVYPHGYLIVPASVSDGPRRRDLDRCFRDRGHLNQAIMVTDTAFYRNPHYHKQSDLPETLDHDRMTKALEGLAGVVTARGRRRRNAKL